MVTDYNSVLLWPEPHEIWRRCVNVYAEVVEVNADSQF